MQDNNKQQTQTRFMLAAVLSLLVLTGYSYFFAPTPPEENANVNANTSQANSTEVAKKEEDKKPAPEETPEEEKEAESEEVEEAPNKIVKIKTPLYEVTLDSKGAVATSWILLVNDSPDQVDRKFLYAQGSTETEKKPLELVSQEGLKREPRQVPFKITTADPSLDKTVNNKNYEVSISDENIELTGSEEKQIDFTLKGADGLEVKKSFSF